MVLVTFQSPVNFHRWKIEQLQIQMEAAPFRSKGGPGAHMEGPRPGAGVGSVQGAPVGSMAWGRDVGGLQGDPRGTVAWGALLGDPGSLSARCLRQRSASQRRCVS